MARNCCGPGDGPLLLQSAMQSFPKNGERGAHLITEHDGHRDKDQSAHSGKRFDRIRRRDEMDSKHEIEDRLSYAGCDESGRPTAHPVCFIVSMSTLLVSSERGSSRAAVFLGHLGKWGRKNAGDGTNAPTLNGGARQGR